MKRNINIRMGWLLLCVVVACSAYSQNDSTKLKRTIGLGEVVVRGNQVSRINNSAFNAIAVDTRKLRNTNLDLAHILDRIPGVKVREDGGLGSQASINLNGFTGKHVKLFIDGVPMDGSSSSFGINNIPVSLASRIEVYKGVVPVQFGGDALGGAINIVTDHSPHTYVDASYSYGSFNTHRSNLSFGSRSKGDFVFRLNAYQNYSDNNYKVKTQWIDLATQAVSNEEGWFKRFHDRYHNEAVVAQIGLVDKLWADKLILGLTYSHEYAQIQTANLMKIVFGGKYRTAHGWTPNLLYEKRNLMIQGLNLRFSARYDMVTTNNVDTLSRTYSWTGEYKENAYQGEGMPTLAEYRGTTLATVLNMNYQIAGHHYFTLNDTYTNYHRKTTNSAANAVQSTAATFMRRVNIKKITGASYQYTSDNKWNVTIFAKYYGSHVKGPVNVSQSGRAEYEEHQRSTQALGYGMAGTYFFLGHDLQLKLSYEKTYRLPTDLELFGDGDYEEGDATLKPEKSHNANLNIGWQHTYDDRHTVAIDAGFNYRCTEDYIIRTIGQKGVAVSSNHGKVRGVGMDLSAHYYYKSVISIGGNFSLQDIRDRERLNSNGAESVTYNNRVPNLPYAFGDADAAYTFNRVLGRFNRLTVGYHLRHVHKFFRSWEGEGAKLYVPNQLSHDIIMTYAIANGRYNISIEANNFTNSLLYDNYSLQKPGRNFSVKFRYVFFKTGQTK
ncbi:MAG: TonB-dependent receptor plug domain-containing protein [Prevotella sp.]|nr:TonB-dependent receptor plug domain-containing protein [Prevotella sp.]